MFRLGRRGIVAGQCMTLDWCIRETPAIRYISYQQGGDN
jgi:hypothetical protein